MATFQEKFDEYLETENVKCARTAPATAAEYFEKEVKKYQNLLNKKQMLEASDIANTFMEDAEDMIIEEYDFPVLHLKSVLEVPHISCVALHQIASGAKSIISQKIAKEYGSDFEINIYYVATYTNTNQVSPRFLTEGAKDQFVVDIEILLDL